MPLPHFFLLQQSKLPARTGSDLANWAQQKGVYPLLVIGGIIVLVAAFVLVAKARRNN